VISRDYNSRRPHHGVNKTVILGSRFLLTGAKPFKESAHQAASRWNRRKSVETARRNPDAVAFGFVAGSWVAAA
jgi:hypothetical protein